MNAWFDGCRSNNFASAPLQKPRIQPKGTFFRFEWYPQLLTLLRKYYPDNYVPLPCARCHVRWHWNFHCTCSTYFHFDWCQSKKYYPFLDIFDICKCTPRPRIKFQNVLGNVKTFPQTHPLRRCVWQRTIRKSSILSPFFSYSAINLTFQRNYLCEFRIDGWWKFRLASMRLSCRYGQ